MSIKCIMKGCANRTDQGLFAGELCMPCYIMIKNGDIQGGSTFISDLNTSYKKVVELLNKHGICRDCGELFEHMYDEPIACCGCGSSEWTKLTPHMEQMALLYDQSIIDMNARQTLQNRLAVASDKLQSIAKIINYDSSTGTHNDCCERPRGPEYT